MRKSVDDRIGEDPDVGLANRLQSRREALEARGVKMAKVVSRAQRHGWTNCNAKKVWQIENRQRGVTQAELAALAFALETDRHWLLTGHGVKGENVPIQGATATAQVTELPAFLRGA
jgi:hypothetical protein